MDHLSGPKGSGLVLWVWWRGTWALSTGQGRAQHLAPSTGWGRVWVGLRGHLLRRADLKSQRNSNELAVWAPNPTLHPPSHFLLSGQEGVPSWGPLCEQ